MRVCRFAFEEMVLTGFYADTHVIPIDQAAEAYSRDNEVELLLPSTEDPLDLLPPDGISYESAQDLHAWIEQLGDEDREELMIPIADVRLLVPIANPPKILLLAGNYAKHVAERGDDRRAAGDVPVRLHETAEHDPDPARRPDRHPARVSRPHRLGVRAGRRHRPPLPSYR